MSKFTTSSVFPDLNVWISLSVSNHEHHSVATRWHDEIRDSTTLIFCRHTQLGLLRLLSTAAVMANEALSQCDCWLAYDGLLQTGAAQFEDEPPGLEGRLRELSSANIVSPKIWADAYLSAFAEAAGLTLVTFDQSLHRRTRRSVLLR